MVRSEEKAIKRLDKLVRWGDLSTPEGKARYERHLKKEERMRARKRRLVEKLLRRPGFREDLDLLRKNYLEGKYRRYKGKPGGHDLRKPYRELRDKYQLDSNWVFWIHHYVSQGINDPNKLYFARFRVNKEKSTVPVVELLIFPETLRGDIDRLWPFIAFELERIRTWQGERIRPTGKRFKTLRGKAREAMAREVYDLIENYHGWLEYGDDEDEDKMPTKRARFRALAAYSSVLGLDDFDTYNASDKELAEHDKRSAERFKKLYYGARRLALS